jgi:N-acetylglucosamine-6-phosphate deacetylase
MLDLSLPEAVRMASAYPAEFLKSADTGRIAPGQRANLVLVDERINVLKSWIDGRED